MKPLLLPFWLALLFACLSLQLVKSDEKSPETSPPLHSNSSMTGPSNSTSSATSKPTPPAVNTTATPVVSNSTSKPTTVAETTATSKPTPPSKEVTTEAVKPTPTKSKVTVTTQKPALPSVTVIVTPKASAAQASPSGFSAASFIGGILLTLGLLAISYVGCKTYHAKRGVQYRTIDEHDAII